MASRKDTAPDRRAIPVNRRSTFERQSSKATFVFQALANTTGLIWEME
jgi:hypothetical protein